MFRSLLGEPCISSPCLLERRRRQPSFALVLTDCKGIFPGGSLNTHNYVYIYIYMYVLYWQPPNLESYHAPRVEDTFTLTMENTNDRLISLPQARECLPACCARVCSKAGASGFMPETCSRTYAQGGACVPSGRACLWAGGRAGMTGRVSESEGALRPHVECCSKAAGGGGALRRKERWLHIGGGSQH